MSVQISFFLIGILFFVGIESNTLSTENFHDRASYFFNLTESAQDFNNTVIKMISNDPFFLTYKSQILEFCNKFFPYQLIRSRIIEIYHDFYTLSDINAMIEFYSSPIGKKLLQTDDKIDDRLTKLVQYQLQKQIPQIITWFQQTFNESMSKNELNQTIYSFQ